MNVQRAEHFRTNLRKAIKALGLSQRALARRVEMSHTHLNYVLNGRVVPGIDLCDRLADAVGVDLEDLLCEPSKFQVTERISA